MFVRLLSFVCMPVRLSVSYAVSFPRFNSTTLSFILSKLIKNVEDNYVSVKFDSQMEFLWKIGSYGPYLQNFLYRDCLRSYVNIL